MNLKKYSLSNIDIGKVIYDTITNCMITLDDIKEVIELAGELANMGCDYKRAMYETVNLRNRLYLYFIRDFMITALIEYNAVCRVLK